MTDEEKDKLREYARRLLERQPHTWSNEDNVQFKEFMVGLDKKYGFDELLAACDAIRKELHGE